jgi:pilus assembly protein TadC
MPVKLESPYLLKMSEPLLEVTGHLEQLTPKLEWDLKRSGYKIESAQFLAIVLYLCLALFITCFALFVILPFLTVISGGELISVALEATYGGILLTLFFTGVFAAYLFFMPSIEIRSRATLVDRDLEYMLKDMRIQLTAGVPLFDTLVNIVRGGYGECSNITEGIIQEVEQGKTITDVLNDVGMWSPSEYLRRMLWQIVNALKSGSDLSNALEAIANDIRVEKENKIKSYGKELNLYGLIYLMFAVIVPSMGVTLLTILSGFLGKDVITEATFWLILIGVTAFQMVFISYVRGKRPIV